VSLPVEDDRFAYPDSPRIRPNLKMEAFAGTSAGDFAGAKSPDPHFQAVDSKDVFETKIFCGKIRRSAAPAART
jgi:hypothetical protein